MSQTSHHDRAEHAQADDVAALAHATEEPKPAPRARPSLSQAVMTFVLEVTAGRARGVADASTARVLRVDAPATRLAPLDLAPDDIADAMPTETLAEVADFEQVATPDDAVIVVGDEPWSAAAGTRTQTRKRARVVEKPAAARSPSPAAKLSATPAAKTSAGAAPAAPPRRLSAWSVSFVVHGLMLAAVSLITITQAVRHEAMDLVMAPALTDELDESELDISEIVDPNAGPSDVVDANAPLAEFTATATGGVIDPGLPTLGMELGSGTVGELTDDIALVGGGGGGAADGPPGGRGGSGGGFGNGTGGSAGFGDGRGGAPTAEFFGAKIDGNRIVFVLDNSGSMQAGRLETVIAELLRSVDALTPKQTFYVVFYSDMAYPLFYPDPANDFVRPTDRTKEELARWLDTVELCLGDSVQEALAGAISIQPDSVILLGDGRIQGEKKMRFLLEAGGGEFPIHTVGVGLGKNAVASRRNLQMIAEANGGEFREAAVPEEMRELALTKPRPYHSQTPGPVWGRNVKGWGKR